MIKTIYGQDALSRLDEDDEDEDEDEETEREESSAYVVEIKSVELIELDELIIGALNQHSYEFAQKGKIEKDISR